MTLLEIQSISYSSHAAILENLAHNFIGDNVFIIVTDLREDSNGSVKTLHYWFSFYSACLMLSLQEVAQTWSLRYVVIEEKRQVFQKFCDSSTFNVITTKHFMLDCCKPNSKQVQQLQKQIATIKGTRYYRLSAESRGYWIRISVMSLPVPPRQ